MPRLPPSPGSLIIATAPRMSPTRTSTLTSKGVVVKAFSPPSKSAHELCAVSLLNHLPGRLGVAQLQRKVGEGGVRDRSLVS